MLPRAAARRYAPWIGGPTGTEPPTTPSRVPPGFIIAAREEPAPSSGRAVFTSPRRVQTIKTSGWRTISPAYTKFSVGRVWFGRSAAGADMASGATPGWNTPRVRRRSDGERLRRLREAVEDNTVELASTQIAGEVVRIGAADRIVVPRAETADAALMLGRVERALLAAEFGRAAAAEAVAAALAAASDEEDTVMIALLLSELS